MNLLALVLYALVNVVMIGQFLLQKRRIYEFPLWAGALAMGWFFPQALAALDKLDKYPAGSYAPALLFATLCTIAIWRGYVTGLRKVVEKPSWFDVQMDTKRLIPAAALLCIAGFFFQWKLMTLPEEMLAQSRWSGAAVKYLFLASIFQFGFLALWLVYLQQNNPFRIDLLVFIVPSLFSILSGALMGRRALMMNAFSYVFVSLWFARHRMLPRWVLLSALFFGLSLVSAIGVYRAVMEQSEDMAMSKRLDSAVKATLAKAFDKDKSGPAQTNEFDNYMFGRAAHSASGKFDWGIQHWNGVVFNYVPAQIVGSGLKQALMFPTVYSLQLAKEKYDYVPGVGTTSTGYLDAFGSWGWLGFIKFWLVGRIMGGLYRRAMSGSFFAKLLYVYLLGTAMHSISHGTQDILCSKWIYFFVLGFPVLYWARVRPGMEEDAQIMTEINHATE